MQLMKSAPGSCWKANSSKTCAFNILTRSSVHMISHCLQYFRFKTKEKLVFKETSGCNTWNFWHKNKWRLQCAPLSWLTQGQLLNVLAEPNFTHTHTHTHKSKKELTMLLYLRISVPLRSHNCVSVNQSKVSCLKSLADGCMHPLQTNP